ncbi:MAG: hypothetical protein JW783_00405 [Bacteroidales bacterium]|nr:hypothetical protein [Bacteroidales bacterium]MBN2748482.1 hypothetical protein [Bacteroidales bacterium]
MNNILKTVGRSGNAGSINLNGIDNYVQLPFLNIDSSFTILGAVNSQGSSNIGAISYNTIIGRSSTKRLLINSVNGLLLAQMGAGNHFSSFPAPLKKWFFFAYVYDRILGGSTWFIDGRNSSFMSGNISINDYLKIGAYDLINYMHNGFLFNYSIFSRALTPNEVKLIHQGLPISRVGLVGEWQMNEMTGSIAYDTSGNGNHATIYGATFTTDKPY